MMLEKGPSDRCQHGMGDNNGSIRNGSSDSIAANDVSTEQSRYTNDLSGHDDDNN